VTAEALPVAAVISDGYEPLFPGLKQLGSCRWQPGMAIRTDVALRGMRAVVKADRSLSATTVIERLDLLSERTQAKKEARRQDTQRQSPTCLPAHPRRECCG
jgi:hypothetical protein